MIWNRETKKNNFLKCGYILWIVDSIVKLYSERKRNTSFRKKNVTRLSWQKTICNALIFSNSQCKYPYWYSVVLYLLLPMVSKISHPCFMESSCCERLVPSPQNQPYYHTMFATVSTWILKSLSLALVPCRRKLSEYRI